MFHFAIPSVKWKVWLARRKKREDPRSLINVEISRERESLESLIERVSRASIMRFLLFVRICFFEGDDAIFSLSPPSPRYEHDLNRSDCGYFARIFRASPYRRWIKIYDYWKSDYKRCLMKIRLGMGYKI